MLTTNHLRILVTEAEAYTKATRECFLDSWDITFEEIYDQQQLIKICSEASYDIIFAKLGLVFDSSIFDLQSDLKILVTPTTGLNHIVLPDAQSWYKNIKFTRGSCVFIQCN